MGSVSIEQIESSTRIRVSLSIGGYIADCRMALHKPFEMVKAGLHWSLKISRQMLPFELMLGW